MIYLRNFTDSDAAEFRQKQNTDLSPDEIRALFANWQEKSFAGRYFEMFAVMKDTEIVGTISLYHHSKSVISCGPEIFDSYRRQGLATQAMVLAMDIAKNKGYKLISQQIRINNTASIALHSKLGFETDGYVYKNKHGNDVQIFIKLL